MAVKACTVCGTPAAGGRCPRHPRLPYGRPHRRASAHVMATATVCWICGQPPTESDPLTADHVVPVSQEGRHDPGNYRAAHRSCNGRRGETPAERTRPSAGANGQ